MSFRRLASLLVAGLVSWGGIPAPAMAQVCTVTCNLTGNINDYWPGNAGVAAGGTSITLGAQRTGAGTAGNTIAAGDWVMVIQMQNAQFQNANNNTYGSNTTSGAGYTAIGQTGRYEFARATNNVGSGGGTLNLASGLAFAYTVTVTGNQTTPTFQIIRLPNCVTANLTGAITGARWNGRTGGVVALRGETVASTTATIDANSLGFRGGATDAHNGPVNTNSFNGTDTDDQYKGEGISGTPDYVFDSSAAIPAEIATGSVLPGGYRGRGAPGNAGGAGEGDSGAGGGGNGGAGGRGGVWSDDIGSNGGFGGGGRGGAAITAGDRAYNRVIMGGGGGGGSSNTGATTANEGFIPYGTGTRTFNRGGPGGGIVILGAVTRTGVLTINANGAGATGTPYTSTTQGSRVGGGGGAGGTVVIYGTGGAVNATANGGDGYDDSLADAEDHTAHGGGGGGGIIYAEGAAAGTTSVTGGNAGCTTSGVNDDSANNCGTNADSSTNGSAGLATTFTGAMPGSPGCAPVNLSVAKSDSLAAVLAGQTTTYTISVVNSGPGGAAGSLVRDPLVSGLNCTTMTFSATPAAGVSTPTLSINALRTTGIELTPTFAANSTATFSLTCGVTATGQ
ncbi:MAG: hypothetical protein V4757_10395 [Pseudomonadota bacterium]